MDESLKRDLLDRYANLGRFGHREHLHLAWSFVQRDGAESAQEHVADFIRHVAERHGDTAKFNETITRFWVRAVGHACTRTRGRDFEAVLAEHSHLLDSALPFRHWSREVLLSPDARVAWVEPDLRPLPF